MDIPQHDTMVTNIRAVFYGATDAEMVEGASWYAAAHTLAKALAVSSGYSVAQCAAVIAVFSPNTPWGRNVTLATTMIESRGAMNRGTFTGAIAKARAILATDDIGVISGIVFGKNGNKVLAFWAGITEDGHTDRVCVDRHAYCIATNDRSITSAIPKMSPKHYHAMAAAYVAAADGTGFTPAQVQAITWVSWRRRFLDVERLDAIG